jgi:iron complex outermembrane recepter protein
MTVMKYSRTGWLFLTAAFGLSIEAALANETAQAPAGAAVTGLEEIVVTARKREERLQETPIAITAFSAEGMEARGVQRVSDVAAFTPNVVFNTTANIASSNSIAVVYIRGVGQDDFTMAIDPGVGIYLDGVYIARSAGSVLEALDFERVEVLRGPQGTLFGRNTIGGAISITTRKPGDELGGKFSAELGKDAMRFFQGQVNIPVNPTLSIGLSVLSKQRDGYVKALQPGIKDFGDEDKLAGRASLRWTPSDNFEVNLAIDGTRQREQAAPLSLVAVNENALFTVLYNQSVGGDCFPVPNRNNPACYSQYYVRAPFETFADFKSTNPLINNDIPLALSPQTLLDVWGISGSAEWNVTDAFTLKSITAYRKTRSDYTRDTDMSPLPLAQAVQRGDYDQISQELQALGRSFDDKLKWILGLYYFKETGGSQDVVEFFVIPLRSGGRYKNDSYAAFGQFTYDVTDQFSVTAGMRYTKDRKRYTPDGVVLGPNFFGIPTGTRLSPQIEAKNFNSAWTPYFNLSYRPTDAAMLYASFSKGFKGGGFTQRVFPPLPEVPAHRPETVEVYEAGFKTEWLDNRLRLNGAAFYNNYKDVQVLVNRGVAPVTENAATARIKGFELEATAVPMENMTIDASLGYVDAKYLELETVAIANGLSLDKRFANTPEWTANAAVDYRFDLGDRGSVRPRLDWIYSGSVFRDATNSPLLFQKAYSVFNGSITYESADSLWNVALIGRNLTNKKYILSGQDQTPLVGGAEIVVARPISWSIKVTRAF